MHSLESPAVPSVSLPGVALLRLDQCGGPAPGNKAFKLEEYLSLARARGITRLVSFGGNWSNHLHALAATGQQQGFDTVGIVRGDSSEPPTAMLADARQWGMRIIAVSRAAYRQRHCAQYQRRMLAALQPCLLIPEGGAGVEGARGCAAIARLLRQSAPAVRQVVVPVGTGTTLAGLVASLDDSYTVLGVSALKGADDLDDRVRHLVRQIRPATQARWHIDHDHHCGGFARSHGALRAFTLAFEAAHGLALEPVYTAKMLFALQRLRDAASNSAPTVAIHTGGLQGRRGFPWLTSNSR